MSTLLRRQTRIVCFFCQTAISPSPTQPLSFLCPHCSCWNRYDANGDILSDDPAMHDESLNRKSFARRASPRKDRLLTTFGSAPFCTTCQSNQRLIVGLLSSYLPPSDDDPDYAPRLAGFTAYKTSIYARYPPVCDRCAPLVEEEIRKKDVMARSNALGSWLNESKKKDTRRQVFFSNMDRHKLNRELRWWAARGALWLVTLLGAVSADVAGAVGRLTLPERSFLVPLLPVFVLLSILWTAWLPTYASFRRAELQGRKVRVRGRERYVTLQAAAWLVRMFTSSLIAVSWYRPSMDYLSLRSNPALISSRVFFSFALCFELFTSVYSILTLRLHRAPAVRLIDTPTSRASTPTTNTTTSRSSSPPPPHTSPTPTTAPYPSRSHVHTSTHDPHDLLDSLSLTAAPIPLRTRRHPHPTTGPSPIFGHSSLKPATFLPPPPAPATLPASQSRDAEMRSRDDEEEDDAMDWSPTTTASPARPAPRGGPPPPLSARTETDATTGLETLLERTNIDASEPGGASTGAGRRGRLTIERTSAWSWGWVYALSLIPLIGVMYYHLFR